MAVSVRDVAATAGVSVGTVSNVLNQPDKVAAATVQRVQAVIAELGFVRNDAARQLRPGRLTPCRQGERQESESWEHQTAPRA